MSGEDPGFELRYAIALHSVQAWLTDVTIELPVATGDDADVVGLLCEQECSLYAANVTIWSNSSATLLQLRKQSNATIVESTFVAPVTAPLPQNAYRLFDIVGSRLVMRACKLPHDAAPVAIGPNHDILTAYGSAVYSDVKRVVLDFDQYDVVEANSTSQITADVPTVASSSALQAIQAQVLAALASKPPQVSPTPRSAPQQGAASLAADQLVMPASRTVRTLRELQGALDDGVGDIFIADHITTDGLDTPQYGAISLQAPEYLFDVRRSVQSIVGACETPPADGRPHPGWTQGQCIVDLGGRSGFTARARGLLWFKNLYVVVSGSTEARSVVAFNLFQHLVWMTSVTITVPAGANRVYPIFSEVTKLAAYDTIISTSTNASAIHLRFDSESTFQGFSLSFTGAVAAAFEDGSLALGEGFFTLEKGSDLSLIDCVLPTDHEASAADAANPQNIPVHASDDREQIEVYSDTERLVLRGDTGRVEPTRAAADAAERDVLFLNATHPSFLRLQTRVSEEWTHAQAAATAGALPPLPPPPLPSEASEGRTAVVAAISTVSAAGILAIVAAAVVVFLRKRIGTHKGGLLGGTGTTVVVHGEPSLLELAERQTDASDATKARGTNAGSGPRYSNVLELSGFLDTVQQHRLSDPDHGLGGRKKKKINRAVHNPAWSSAASSHWSLEITQALVKAVSLQMFPDGTCSSLAASRLQHGTRAGAKPREPHGGPSQRPGDLYTGVKSRQVPGNTVASSLVKPSQPSNAVKVAAAGLKGEQSPDALPAWTHKELNAQLDELCDLGGILGNRFRLHSGDRGVPCEASSNGPDSAGLELPPAGRCGGQGLVAFGSVLNRSMLNDDARRDADTRARGRKPSLEAWSEVAVKFHFDLVAYEREKELAGNRRLVHCLPTILYASTDDKAVPQLAPNGRPWPPYFVLPRGEPLDDYVEKTAADAAARGGARRGAAGVDPITCIQILMHLACRLELIHAAGLVHCDLKPANTIYLCEWQIIDLGQAQWAGTNAPLALTPEYAAPEQVAKWMRIMASQAHGVPVQPDDTSILVTPALDVWALGLMGYELLADTERDPLGKLGKQHMWAALHGALPLPWESDADYYRNGASFRGLGPQFVYWIQRMLSRNPEERPTMAECVDGWRAALHMQPREALG